MFSRAQARAAGYAGDEIDRRVAVGVWRRVRRGQYAEAVDRSSRPEWERRLIEHRESVHAVVNSCGEGSLVISHQSALVLHELPLFGVSLDDVHVTRRTKRGYGLLAGVRNHAARLMDADCTNVGVVPVTTPARAAFETAAVVSFETAVVFFDALLRRRLLTEDDCARLTAVTRCWPGANRITAALGFADSRAESAGESRLRVLFRLLGLPTPELQVVFGDETEPFARVDFYFSMFRTVVEFDGRIKYGSDAPEVVLREKLREDRLRDQGLEVVRVTWQDLADPAALLIRLRRAFDRAARRQGRQGAEW